MVVDSLESTVAVPLRGSTKYTFAICTYINVMNNNSF